MDHVYINCTLLSCYLLVVCLTKTFGLKRCTFLINRFLVAVCWFLFTPHSNFYHETYMVQCLYWTDGQLRYDEKKQVYLSIMSFLLLHLVTSWPVFGSFRCLCPMVHSYFSRIIPEFELKWTETPWNGVSCSDCLAGPGFGWQRSH